MKNDSGVHEHKATFRAGSDIALIKYWGKKNEILRLPENGSISIVLDSLNTTTTVEFCRHFSRDEVVIDEKKDDDEASRVITHLDRIRKLAQFNLKAKVVSKNSFPASTGLSSSGSGFAALTLAATKAAGLQLSERELSILARQGSGTACRCVCGGFVEWKDGKSSDTSFSQTIFPAGHWDLRDVVVVVDEGKKRLSSTEGHMTAKTSVFYETRQRYIREKIYLVKKAIREKDFSALGELVEVEALEFHAILLTSKPNYIALYSGTVEVMLAVQEMRREGIEAYFTINTGFNVHVLTLPKYEKMAEKYLRQLPTVKRIIQARVGEGQRELTKHLF